MMRQQTVPEMTIGRLDTPLGEALVAFDERSRVCAFDWADHEERMVRLLRRQYRAAPRVVPGEVPAAIKDRFTAYFSGDLRALEALEVATGGTPFQREVWAALREIPAGQTLSYGELAQKIGRPRAVRAVGLANGANPVGVAVPCHRVIGADGSLTGYGGGLERKRWLLAHEGAS